MLHLFQVPLPVPPDDFGSFLTWLLSTATLGAIFTFLLNWDWLKSQVANDKLRLLIAGAVTLVLGVGAYLGTTYIPGGLVEAINPYWRIVVMIFIFITSAYGANAVRVVYSTVMSGWKTTMYKVQAQERETKLAWDRMERVVG